MTTTIYLIRHGETLYSKQDYFSGISDLPLIPEGIEQAKLLSQRFLTTGVKFDLIVTSPLQRCQQSASILSLGSIPQVISHPLRELNYGAWEGKQRNEILLEYPDEYKKWNHDPYTIATPDGESGKQLVERVIPELTRIVNENPSKNIAVVAHKTVNRIILCWVLGIPYKHYRRKIVQYPACVNVINFTDNHALLVRMNDISHYSPDYVLT